MTMSPYGETLILTALLTTTAITRPSGWFVGLHTGPTGAAGATNEIVAHGYARQPQSFTVAGNVATGVANLIFGPDSSVDWGTVTDFSVWDAATGGNCLWTGSVAASVAFAVGDSATIAAAALTFQIT